jgi:hypothetical protein
MSFDNQCFAPSSMANGRCTNKSINGYKHCELHRPKAAKLYAKYKKLSYLTVDIDLNKKFDDTMLNIEYIFECYNAFNRVYNARLKHRKYAIAPNLYDKGHDTQFEMLTHKLDQCEQILSMLFVLYSKTSDINKEHKMIKDSKDSKDKITILNDDNFNRLSISDRIKLSREHRRQREEEINLYVEKYIGENRIIINRKNALIDKFKICVVKLFATDIICVCIQTVIIVNIIHVLNVIGYFSQNFKPRSCVHPGCDCKLPYTLSLGSEYFDGTHHINEYIESFSEETIKSIFELLLFNKNKILPFVDDIIELYDKFDHQIIYADVMLEWDINRLKLVEDLEPEYIDPNKHSKLFAMRRLKDKYYHRELSKKLFA